MYNSNQRTDDRHGRPARLTKRPSFPSLRFVDNPRVIWVNENNTAASPTTYYGVRTLTDMQH